MTPYLFTLTFLMMITCLTSSESVRFHHSMIEKNIYASANQTRFEREELSCLSDLDEIRGQESEDPKKREPRKVKPPTTRAKRYPALRINTARPPNNARLNLYALLHAEPNKNVPEEFSLYETCAALLRLLYSHASFFHEVPRLEYVLLDALCQKKEQCVQFSSPDELGSLVFEDPQLQAVFYRMLKGTKESDSLLDYITFDQQGGKSQARKINLLFADPLILKAIFPKGQTAENLLARRELIWQEIAIQEAKRNELKPEQCDGRRGFAVKIAQMLDEVLIADGFDSKKYKGQVFDCTLGKSGTVLFHIDSETAGRTREPYHPPQRKQPKT